MGNVKNPTAKASEFKKPPAKKTTAASKNKPKESKIEEINKKYLDLEKKCMDLEDQLLRSVAESQNIQSQAKRDVARARQFAIQPILEELIVIDESLHRGLEAYEEDHNPKSIHEGMTMTANLMGKILKKFHIEVIDPLHQTFNPRFHEAMTTIKDKQHKPNTILQVIQKGYILHERVIRPARVIVAA
jgi:molecular chaperone GrpE